MFILKLLREQRGITLRQLSEEMGVSWQAVQQWESGETLPRVEHLQALAKFFSVSMEELLGKKNSPI